MLRPGRLTLSAKPATTGSATLSKTIGIVLVAACAALTAFVVDATMRSTRSFTSSAASAGSRSLRVSAKRSTSVKPLPST